MAEGKQKIPKTSGQLCRWGRGGPESAQKSGEALFLPPFLLLLLLPLLPSSSSHLTFTPSLPLLPLLLLLPPASSRSAETCFPIAFPKLTLVLLTYIPPLKDSPNGVDSELSGHTVPLGVLSYH